MRARRVEVTDEDSNDHSSSVNVMLFRNHCHRVRAQVAGLIPSTKTFNTQDPTCAVSGEIAPTYDVSGEIEPTYDNNADMISDQGRTFVFDAWNRLVAARSGSTRRGLRLLRSQRLSRISLRDDLGWITPV